MRKIKVGTIGYGGAFNMGRHHLNDLLKNPGFQASAVCDVDPERVKIATTDFPGIETYTDVGTMLKKSDVELLVIILPHNLHAPVAVQCLEAGRHCVVEKPFALTVEECDAMIAAAKKKKLMVSTFHNRHWDSNILTILKHLPKIGRPFRWESFHGGYAQPKDWWRSDKKISGGVIFDWGAHFCEWMLQVMDYEMQEIGGFQVNEVWKNSNEDELQAVVRFKGNAVGSHVASDIALAPRDMIQILGTKGAIVATHRSVDVYTRDKAGATVRTSVAMEPARNSDYYANVHDHLHKGKPLVITPEWARRVIQILDYAGRSAAKGQALKPKYA